MRRRNLNKSDGYKILIVDDEIGIIDSLTVVLGRNGYRCEGVTNPVEAIEKIRNEHYDILILDFLMQPIHGDKVVERIREFDKELYILLLTGHKDLAPPLETIRRLEIQGYCEKSDRFEQLLLLVESGIKSILQMQVIKEYSEELKNTYDRLRTHYMDTVEALRLAVDAKDIYTRGHSDRVSYYCVKIGQSLGLPEDDIELLRISGIFHDIGKIGTTDDILLKTGKLDESEYEEIKKHPLKGAHILSAVSMFKDVVPIVRTHHERIDGKGYPLGLKDEETPFLSRIVAVADAFDAMMSNRIYRAKIGLAEAKDQLIKGAGTQFDKSVVDTFMKLLENYDEIEKGIYNTVK